MSSAPPPPERPSYKKLARTDGPVAGVCGGLAAYAGIDPTVVRVLVAVAALLTLPVGPLVYLVLIFVMPKR